MKNIEKHFNHQSSMYEKAIRCNFIWRTIKAKEKMAVLTLLSAQKNEHILDAGSGPGIYAEILKNKGCQVICVDVASSMIDLVKQKGIVGRISDVEDFSIQQKFDKIICLGTLEFVRSPEKALSNLAAHLKPGGFMVILVPMRSILGYSYKMMHYLHGISIRIFSQDGIRSLLYKTGFKIDKMIEVSGLSCVIKIQPVQKS
ncbi:MAG: class I SAM-dependent methyltransferase [Candidatus Omnitrophica bacterium]|nr:class I SAM-dependent methyltransferase [Candidatus Omnitrophota bacterium]